ncbi:response regulator receiver protein [Dyadobacter fermentans DSM 18053]|uniref:Response regulator receiver protein n=1 Tax=Dyadobacter fermentans (strain ATCC 700827 / DSM 18053 / CIP 107007 / KCTC 52180 / NS114) TaxID=471854 RepID=C6VW41_DYAFD|nr:response regulator receiver protein [Dyadobacter fermentans DSM 18053]
MKNSCVVEAALIVIVDNRPMYRSGVKYGVESIVPGCKFSDYDQLSDLLLDRKTSRSIYFMISVRNMSNKTIIGHIRKLRSVQKKCKIRIYGYQQSTLDIIYFLREKISGYLSDEFSESELVECFSALTENRIYVDLQIAIELMIAYRPIRSRKKQPVVHVKNNLQISRSYS